MALGQLLQPMFDTVDSANWTVRRRRRRGSLEADDGAGDRQEDRRAGGIGLANRSSARCCGCRRRATAGRETWKDQAMTAGLIAAAVRLADIIAQENAALRAIDLARAGMLRRQAGRDRALRAAQQAGLVGRRGECGPWPRALQAPMAPENRLLLERAIAVQGRVIGTSPGHPDAARPRPAYGAKAAEPRRPRWRRGPVRPRLTRAWVVARIRPP